MNHWLCVAVCRPQDESSIFYPDVTAVAPDRSQIQLETTDGNNLRHFGPVTCRTLRLAHDDWVNTQHYKPNEFDCLVTDSRVVISQSRYNKAQSGGPAIVPIWLAPFTSDTETSADQSVLAGHVRYPWILMIAARGPKYVTPTLVHDWGVIRLVTARPESIGGTQFCLEIHLNQAVRHDVIAHDLARRVASHRLGSGEQLGPEKRAAWQNLPSSPTTSSSANGAWLIYNMPSYWPVGTGPRRPTSREGSS